MKSNKKRLKKIVLKIALLTIIFFNIYYFTYVIEPLNRSENQSVETHKINRKHLRTAAIPIKLDNKYEGELIFAWI